MLDQKRLKDSWQQWLIKSLGLLALVPLLLVYTYTDNWQKVAEADALNKATQTNLSTTATRPELAPHQTIIGQIGETWIVFDGNLYLPDGRQSLSMIVDALMAGAYRHLDDPNGFLDGKYKSQGDVMPYDAGKAQEILRQQGVKGIQAGDGAIINILPK